MSKKKNTDSKSNSGVDLLDREKHDLKPPSKYNVVFYNDNYTPMDFVIVILMDAFNYSFQKANSIMMQVHEQGKGIAGVYSKEIAMMKVKRCNQIARAEGHPLLITMEEQ